MNEEFLKVAKQAALEAGKIIQKYSGQKNNKNIKNNDNSDFSTQADLESEKKIVEIISKNFPGHNIIAEEKTRIDNKSEYTWVIDPLDGTFAFAIGIPYFCVSIALIKDNEVILGVIYQPELDCLYYGQVGKGAYLNNKMIGVSKKDQLDKSAVVLDAGHRAKRPERMKEYILPLINKIAQPYELGSGIASQAFVASGVFDAFLNQSWIWDLAAGAVIIKEAGGKVTDFEGREIDWSKDRVNMVASNGLIHNEILEALKK